MTNPLIPARRANYPQAAVLLFALLALIDSVFNYFWTGNGIHGTEGALLVIVSSLLLTIAAGLIFNNWLHGWVHTLFEVLIFADFVGTALAAYLLEAWILLILVAIGFIAWVVHLLRPTPSLSTIG